MHSVTFTAARHLMSSNPMGRNPPSYPHGRLESSTVAIILVLMKTRGRWARLNLHLGCVWICPAVASLRIVCKNACERMVLGEKPTDCDPLRTMFRFTRLESGIVEEIRSRKQGGYATEIVILVA